MKAKREINTLEIPAGAPSTVTSRRSRQGLGGYHGIGRLRKGSQRDEKKSK